MSDTEVSNLSFATLRHANLLRVTQFKDAKGRICHPDGIENWTVAQWLQAVVGELGEFANLHKKVDRGDFTLEEIKDKLADELADVQTYLDLLAARLDIDLGDATVSKFNRISERVESTIKISTGNYVIEEFSKERSGE